MKKLCYLLAMLSAAICLAQTAPTIPAGRGKGQPDAFLPSAVDTGKYKVEANIAYDKHPATVLDMIYPREMAKNDASKKYPGVIMFHGGGWIRTSKSTMSTFYNRYLNHGFVVCNAEYRMADATGQFSPENSIAPAAVNDALAAAKWFYDHAAEYNVDRERIVVTGASAGGHLALMVGMATPEAKLGPTAPQDFKIAAIVDGYGPTDVSDLLARGTSWAKQWLPEGTPDREELAKRLSPVTYARKEMPPLLIVHGSRDNTVPVPQAEKLTKLLQEKGADVTLHLVEGAGHGYQTPPTAWPDAEKAMFDWLTKKGITR